MSGQGSKRVAVIAGDGIGPEVVESALVVLRAAGASLDLVHFEIGLGRWKRTGEAMDKMIWKRFLAATAFFWVRSPLHLIPITGAFS